MNIKRKIAGAAFMICMLPGGAIADTIFKAGAAQVNITPGLGTIINGGFLPLYAKDIHDSLYAKAIAFSSGNIKLLVVEVDITAMDALFVKHCKELIKLQTGLQPQNVLIASTHSHSCGAVTQLLFCQPDFVYRNELPALIAASAVMALKNLRPAKVAWGKVDVPEHVSCRRYFMKPGYPLPNPFGGTDKVRMNPDEGEALIDHASGPVDPAVGFIAIKGNDNKWIALLANYSLHYVGDFEGGIISADYFGITGETLREQLHAGKDFVGIMTNGTSGDVNSMDFFGNKKYPSGPFEKSRLIAARISSAIAVSLSNASWSSDPLLAAAFAEVPVRLRKPAGQNLDSALKRFRAADYNALSSLMWTTKEMWDVYAFMQLRLAQRPDSMNVPVQALRIGAGTIGTLPGEFFAETGLKLKAAVPCKNYFTVCLANEYVGYVPPAEQIALGGYETWQCTNSCLEMHAEDNIRNALLDLIVACNK